MIVDPSATIEAVMVDIVRGLCPGWQCLGLLAREDGVDWLVCERCGWKWRVHSSGPDHRGYEWQQPGERSFWQAPRRR